MHDCHDNSYSIASFPTHALPIHKLQLTERWVGLRNKRLVTVFCHDDNRTGSSHAYTSMQILIKIHVFTHLVYIKIDGNVGSCSHSNCCRTHCTCVALSTFVLGK